MYVYFPDSLSRRVFHLEGATINYDENCEPYDIVFRSFDKGDLEEIAELYATCGFNIVEVDDQNVVDIMNGCPAKVYEALYARLAPFTLHKEEVL